MSSIDSQLSKDARKLQRKTGRKYMVCVRALQAVWHLSDDPKGRLRLAEQRLTKVHPQAEATALVGPEREGGHVAPAFNFTSFMEPALTRPMFTQSFELIRDTDGPSIPPAMRSALSESGLYKCRLTTGMEYIGEAEDVLRRCGDHRRKSEWWNQVESMAFAPVADVTHHRKLLERLTIYRRLSEGFELLNTVHTQSSSVGRPEVPPIWDVDALDKLERALLASDDEAARFDFEIPAPSGAEPDRKTRQLLNKRSGAEVDAIIEVFAYFVRYALRAPVDTIKHHWKVHSSMKVTGPHRFYTLASLVVQDIPFVHIRKNKDDDGIHVQVHLDPQPRIDSKYRPRDDHWEDMLKGESIQIVEASPEVVIEAMSDDEVFRAAARRTASRLMRSGPCTTGHAHHQWVIDSIFEHIREAGLD